MLEKIITALGLWIISVISALGYGGIVLLMAIESACIPLPSEIIMPFSGYLVSQGQMTLWGVALAGAIGCVLGSIPAYYLGQYGGRPLIERYGKYVLVFSGSLAAGGAYLHCVSSRRGAHGDGPLHRLYLCRLADLVLGVGLCGQAPRR